LCASNKTNSTKKKEDSYEYCFISARPLGLQPVVVAAAVVTVVVAACYEQGHTY